MMIYRDFRGPEAIALHVFLVVYLEAVQSGFELEGLKGVDGYHKRVPGALAFVGVEIDVHHYPFGGEGSVYLKAQSHVQAVNRCSSHTVSTCSYYTVFTIPPHNGAPTAYTYMKISLEPPHDPPMVYCTRARCGDLLRPWTRPENG